MTPELDSPGRDTPDIDNPDINVNFANVRDVSAAGTESDGIGELVVPPDDDELDVGEARGIEALPAGAEPVAQDAPGQGDGVWPGLLDHLLTVRELCPLGLRIRDLAGRDGDILGDLESLVDDLTRQIVDSAPVRERGPRPQRMERGRRCERTRVRVARYARTQDMFKRNPSRLADLVIRDDLGALDGEDRGVEPPAEATVALFERLWGVAGPCTEAFVGNPPNVVEDVRLFTEAEVRGCMRGLKPGGAPGLDGVTKGGLLARPHLVGTLTVLFNTVLFRGVYPSGWRKCRTTLIPKPRKDLTQPENWRPITISPLLARMYSSLLEKRLQSFVSVSERQRGFRKGNGCYMNCTVLDEVIRLGKRSSLVGLQLDVSKAFDTVSHEAIKRALVGQGVPSVLRSAIQMMYRGSSTLLGSLGVEIELRRGVKQGDPLSPLLFNLVLDPLLRRLEMTGHGFNIGGESLAAMAYADDITLFSQSVRGMESLLSSTADYLAGTGMGLSVAKCLGFRVEKKGDAWVALETGLSLDGQPIKSCSASTPFDYLGLTYTLSKGFNNRERLLVLERAVERARGLALKPQQKVQLIQQYIVPCYIHRFTIDPPSANDLTRVDRTLRGEIKKILHLPQCTTDGLLYARKRDGGLGLPRLDTLLKHATLRVGQELLWTEDRVLGQVKAVSSWESRQRAIAQRLGIEWPPTLRDITNSRRRAKTECLETWAGLESQGVGVEWFRDDPLGNYWLLNQSCLRPGQFIDALSMRANVFGTRVAMNRATRTGITVCRQCRDQPESLGHVLGQCLRGQRARVERHDWIARAIREECLAKGAVVAREQSFEIGPDLRLRPDLIVKSGDKAYVVDVTVRFENGNSLAVAALEKKTKYAPVVPVVQRQLGTTMGEVIPVVLGSRGAMPKSTLSGLRKLGITRRGTLLDLSLVALRTSIDIARRHVDYG